MARTNWQDPKTSEIISPHISGLQEAVGKIEDILDMQVREETGVALSEVYIADDDRYRIYQAPEGKRNWASSPAPIIKKNGTVITSGFEIDYGGGAVVFDVAILANDILTADVTYTIKTGGIFKAENIDYENTGSELEAITVQGAIDEVNDKIDGISLGAENISYDNTDSGLDAADVQGAIDEIEGAKVNRPASAVSGNIAVFDGGAGKLKDSGVSPSAFMVPGNTILAESLEEESISGTSQLGQKCFIMPNPGRYRITGELMSNTDGNDIIIKIGIPGVGNYIEASAEYRTSSTSYGEFSIDMTLPVSPYGLVSVVGYSNGSGKSGKIRNVRVRGVPGAFDGVKVV